MASSINITGLTLNPLEVGELGSFIVERTFEDPTLRAVHAVWTGVKMKEQIAFAGQLTKTGIKDSTCTRPNSGAKSTFSQLYWEPANVGDTLVHCQADVNALFKAYYGKIQAYVEKFDITGSDLENLLSVLLSDAALRAVWRYAWLGDTDVAQAGAAAAGVKLAADVKFYDAVDGIWKQAFTNVSAGDLERYSITENSEATTTAQLTLADGRAVEIFEEMWSKADSRLRSDPTAQFLVSRQIFENYRKYLQGKGENFSIDYTMDGLPSLRWNGKQIVNMETVWDLNLQSDFVDNTTNEAYYLPNRVMLTVPANIPIGTLNENDMTTLESWYERKERQMYTAYGFTLDAKLLENYMAVVAY